MKIQEIPIKDIHIIENHRLKIEDDSIAELMQSIKQNGLKQPIGVSLNKNKQFDLIFGNRRLIACQKLGWKTIRAQVEEGIDLKQLMILNVTENLQRKDPSFAEFGRLIEKLVKLGLTTKEVSIRVGVDEKKVAMILNTYLTLPAKHRGKVKFLGKGKREKGAIPAQVATAIIRLKKDFGLDDKHVDELIEYVGKGDMVRDNLKNIVTLLKTGISFKDALEKSFDYEVYHIDFVAERSLVGRLCAEAGIPSAQLLLKRILYGKAPAIKKPDFIKI